MPWGLNAEYTAKNDYKKISLQRWSTCNTTDAGLGLTASEYKKWLLAPQSAHYVSALCKPLTCVSCTKSEGAGPA